MTRRQLETLRELVRVLATAEPDLHPKASAHHKETVAFIHLNLAGVDLAGLLLVLDGELRLVPR